MNFTVIWDPGAEQELAAVWTGAADRGAVTRAAHAIEQRLQRDPVAEGESRPGDRRLTFERPLALLFRVSEGDRVVRVLNVWTFR